MSTYRRYKGGYTERWSPDSCEWHPCPPDEPETRRRKPNEGMVILPGEMTGDVPSLSLDDFIALLGGEDRCPKTS